MRNTLLMMFVLVSLLVTACATPVQSPEDAPTESARDAEVPAATPAPDAADEEMTDSGMTDLDALVVHPWQWVSFRGPDETFDVEMPASYLVLFNTDGIVDITADCNTAIASYGVASLDAGSLSMEVAPKTNETCPPESRGKQFLTLLATAADYAYVDDQLHIGLASDGGTMVFAPAAAD